MQEYESSNERLEFLGDAVLGSVAAHYLFRKYPLKDEGFLTRVRSRMVSRNFLNGVAQKMGIDELISRNQSDRISKSALGDALEALIGAIYLDRGYRNTSRFILDKIITLHVDINELVNTDIDFKSRVLEWANREKKNINFVLVSEERFKGISVYTVNLMDNESLIASGKGNSKKEAEQRVAQQACEKLAIPERF
jgi:ribonuclease III